MHTSEKNAPKAGTLVYRVDESNFQDDDALSTFVIVHEGSEVKVVRVKDPHWNGMSTNFTTYVPDLFSPTLDAALDAAIKRLDVRQKKDKNLAEQLSSKRISLTNKVNV